MAGTISPPETLGNDAVLTGSAPVANMRDYAAEVAAYTRGQGRLFCTLKGYEVCHNQEEVVEAVGYNSEQDLDNPADSVFCSHGAGFVVKWDQVRDHMHLEGLDLEAPGQAVEEGAAASPRAVVYSGGLEQDKELQAIFERTYGEIKPKAIRPRSEREAAGAGFGRCHRGTTGRNFCWWTDIISFLLGRNSKSLPRTISTQPVRC